MHGCKQRSSRVGSDRVGSEQPAVTSQRRPCRPPKKAATAVRGFRQTATAKLGTCAKELPATGLTRLWGKAECQSCWRETRWQCRIASCILPYPRAQLNAKADEPAGYAVPWRRQTTEWLSRETTRAAVAASALQGGALPARRPAYARHTGKNYLQRACMA